MLDEGFVTLFNTRPPGSLVAKLGCTQRAGGMARRTHFGKHHAAFFFHADGASVHNHHVAYRLDTGVGGFIVVRQRVMLTVRALDMGDQSNNQHNGYDRCKHSSPQRDKKLLRCCFGHLGVIIAHAYIP